MKANSKLAIYTVKVITSGQTVENSRENMSSISWKEMVVLLGKMAESTKAITLTTTNKDMVSSRGPTVENTKATGPMASNTEKEFISIKMGKNEKGSGK